MTLPTLAKIKTIQEMFPKCYYCGGSIRKALLHELVKIADKDRLAHRDCLAAEAEASDDAA